MSVKDIKSEARQKLPLNMHQAIVIYTIEYAIFITLITLISVACVLFGAINNVAVVVIIIYGVVLGILALVMSGIVNYALVDFYLASYKCKPYNIRRLGDTVARNSIVKILALNLVRTLLGVLLLACLIVPGVFYLSRTSMANHLLNANPKMKATTALSASGKVMSGKLGRYLALQFSMFGWYALGVVTLGIGFIFILPYLNTAKTVYYKRALQGDKTVYKMPIQPVSPEPVPVQQPQTVAVAATPVVQPIVEQSPVEPARPIKIDTPIPPIATLVDSDVAAMNEAIEDFGGEGVDTNTNTNTHTFSGIDQVPEVPLTPPVSQTRKDMTKSSDRIEQKLEQKIDDSDLVEIVKPLSTREVDESNAYERAQVDALYTRSNPRSDEKLRNYVVESGGTQSPDDFITSEFHGDAPNHAATVTRDVPVSAGDDVSSPKESAQSDPIMSDDDFAEFIRNFDVPTPESTFTPLKKRTVSEENGSAAQTQPKAGATTPVYDAHRNESGFAARSEQQKSENIEEPPLTTRNRPQPTRSDRARLEREERLRNIRKR